MVPIYGSLYCIKELEGQVGAACTLAMTARSVGTGAKLVCMVGWDGYCNEKKSLESSPVEEEDISLDNTIKQSPNNVQTHVETQSSSIQIIMEKLKMWFDEVLPLRPLPCSIQTQDTRPLKWAAARLRAIQLYKFDKVCILSKDSVFVQNCDFDLFGDNLRLPAGVFKSLLFENSDRRKKRRYRVLRKSPDRIVRPGKVQECLNDPNRLSVHGSAIVLAPDKTLWKEICSCAQDNETMYRTCSGADEIIIAKATANLNISWTLLGMQYATVSYKVPCVRDISIINPSLTRPWDCIHQRDIHWTDARWWYSLNFLRESIENRDPYGVVTNGDIMEREWKQLVYGTGSGLPGKTKLRNPEKTANLLHNIGEQIIISDLK